MFQNQTNGELVRIKGNGDVTINSGKLYLPGTANASGGEILFASTSNGSVDKMSIKAESSSSMSFYSDATFKFIESDNNTELVEINQTDPYLRVHGNLQTQGNIGIGTDNPDYKLHIEGTFVGDDSCNIKLVNTSVNGISYIQRNNDGKSYFINSSAHDLILGTSNNYTDHLVLKSDGKNVGIGTTNPAHLLHVRADVTGNNGGVYISRNNTSDANGGNWLFNSWYGGKFIIQEWNNSNTYKRNVLSFEKDTANVTVETGNFNVTNGSVGIGTNAPQVRLHTYVNGDNYMRIQSSTGTQAALQFYDSASRWIMYKPGNSTDLRFYGNSADRVTFTEDGNVGIGTNIPDKKLHVMVANTEYSSHVNSSMILESTSSNYLNFITTDGQSSGLLFGNSSSTSHGGVTYQDTGNMMFNTGGNVTRMVIDQSGEVGIGNTAPSEKLEVTGNIKIDNGQTGSGLTGGKLIFDSSYDVTGVNKINLLNDTYGFGVDDNTIKYISGGTSHKWYYSSTSGQNGTLGMTLESGNLTVEGNLTIQGSTTTLNTTTLTVEDHHIELGVGAVDDAAVDGGGIILKGTTDKSITWNNSNSEWLSNKDFTVSGTVQNTETLIKKSTNPVLQLEQETYYYTGEATTSGDVGTIRFQNKDTDKRATIVGHVFDTKQMPSILFKTGATAGNLDTRMSIREDGKIGIGTDSPDYNLEIVGSDHTYLTVRDASNKNAEIRLLEGTSDYGFSLQYHGSEANDFRIISRSNGSTSTRLCIERDNGRVGIGTTNPSYFTHIHSNMNDVFKLQTTGGGALNFKASDYSIAAPVWNIQSGGSEDIAFSISSNPGEIMRLHNNGNVGIGTNNPQSQLHLKGTGDVQLKIDADSDNVGENQNPSILLTQDGEAVQLKMGIIGDAGQIITNSLANYSYLSSFAPSASTNVGLQFATQSNGNGEVRMTIDNVGNVGIGTTSPDHLLHVNGNARIGKGGNANVAVSGGDRYLKISAESEVNNAAVYLGCCHDENGAHKTAIIADNVSNWSRSNLHFCLNDDTTSNGIEQDATLSHSRMTILNGGNVGIGITNPLKKCHVNGELLVTGENDSYQNEQKQLIFGRGNRNSFERHHYISGRVDSSSSPAGNYLKFNIDTGSGNGGETFSETMILRGDGNVGIGTTNPIEKLDVNGNMILTTNGVNIQRQTDANYDSYFSNLEREIIRYGDSQCSLTGANNQSVTHKIILGYNLDDKRQYDTADAYTPGQNAIKFQLANSTQSNTTPSINTRMIITGNGSVGIGTTNPGTHLHSIMTANGDSIPDTGINESCHTALGVMGSTPYGLAIGTFQSSGDSWIQAKRFTNGDKFRLLLNPDGGNVGIGVTNPQRTLDLSTTGQITFGDNVTNSWSSYRGIYWHSGDDYGIYRTGGAWSGDYAQLKIKFATGIILDPGSGTNNKSHVGVVGGMAVGTNYYSENSGPTASAASWNNGMIVEGNVGIGTTNPEAPLQIGSYYKVGDQNSKTLPARGWYRIAKIETTGIRGGAVFTLRDTRSSGGHSHLKMIVGMTYGREETASLTVLSHSYYGTRTFTQARLIHKDTFDSIYLEVYVHSHATSNIPVSYVIENIAHEGDWVPVNWEDGSIPTDYISNTYNLEVNYYVQIHKIL